MNGVHVRVMLIRTGANTLTGDETTVTNTGYSTENGMMLVTVRTRSRPWMGSSAKIIADTHHTTGAFSNIVLDAEEVIWGGDDKIGFHTSHLTRRANTRPQLSISQAAGSFPTCFMIVAAS